MRALLFIHLVAVCFWLGSQLFVIAVLTPALRSKEPGERRELFRAVGHLYGVISVPVLLVILVTGMIMASKFDLGSVPAFQIKMGAVAVVLAGTIAHSWAAKSGARAASRAASMVTLVATLIAVWCATGF